MKVVCLIPARLESTRLNEKLIQLLDDKSVIQHTYLNAKATQLFDEVIVVGNNEKIERAIVDIKGKYIQSVGEYECGTDRIAAVAKNIDADVFINLQGDEPFVNKNILTALVELFSDETVEVATLKHKISEQDAANPNFVKVVVDNNDNALLFSRARIPYNREGLEHVDYFKHIGIYAFTKKALLHFATLPLSSLEKIEKLENLRMLQNGMRVKLLEVHETPIGIDTADDLQKAIELLKENKSSI